MQMQRLQAAAEQKVLLKNSSASHHEPKAASIKDITSSLGTKIDTKA
jgi:hypothetical protein